MRRIVVLSPYNRVTYLDEAGNYVVKTCSQKFHLHVRFITRLSTCACAGACACDRTPLLKRPGQAGGRGGFVWGGGGQPII